MSDTTSRPDRICESCRDTFPGDTPRWYIDPEGVELCPECADDLWVEWKLGGHANDGA